MAPGDGVGRKEGNLEETVANERERPDRAWALVQSVTSSDSSSLDRDVPLVGDAPASPSNPVDVRRVWLAARDSPPSLPIADMCSRFWLTARPPLRPASRASSGENSCAVPF
jgi:hypothetical protein